MWFREFIPQNIIKNGQSTTYFRLIANFQGLNRRDPLSLNFFLEILNSPLSPLYKYQLISKTNNKNGQSWYVALKLQEEERR